MTRRLDGRFYSVNRFSGEIRTIIVPNSWVPPYHNDSFWGIKTKEEPTP